MGRAGPWKKHNRGAMGRLREEVLDRVHVERGTTSNTVDEKVQDKDTEMERRDRERWGTKRKTGSERCGQDRKRWR